VTFIDDPQTLSNLRYTLCSDSHSSGNMSGNVTRVRVTLFELKNAADLAEVYPTADGFLTPGEVVTIDPLVANGVKRTQGAYDRNMLGVVSTEPAMVIGGTGGQAHGAAVALSGRVPVKVTGEYGQIKQGDMLTSSPVPGMAMKAVKAGPILGIALEDFAGDGTGTVMMFIKSGWYNGSNLAEIFNDPTITDPTKVVLDRVVSDIPAIDPKSENLSVMFTDRVVAGLEIITPKLTADKVFTRVISPVGEENLTFELSGGQVIFKNQDASGSGIILDASGSARFTGGITADWIKANRIEGIEVLAARYSGLERKVASLSGMIVNSPTPTVLPLPTITPAASLDMTILGELVAKKGLTVYGPALFSDDVVFGKLTTFNNPPVFNMDTAGEAVIKAGSDRVDIVFDKAYPEPPVVSVVISLNSLTKTDGTDDEDGNKELEKQVMAGNYSYVISRKSGRGFSILLNKKADSDVVFSWTAWGVKDMKTFTSNPPVLVPSFTGVTVTKPVISPLPTMVPGEGASVGAVLKNDEEVSHSATIK
jgi:hypothetical protein